MVSAPVQAAIYCRLSLAKFGDTTKVEDQERICRDLCTARGWEVLEVYADNNRSAWQRNRKRPGWDAMLEAVEAGKVTAIVIYHGDRLVRQPWDLELLINFAYGKGIKLASPTGTRDLSNDDDLFILRIEVAAACRESASTSRRKKLEHEKRRRAGLVRSGGRGGRPYGFHTDGVTHVSGEGALIREAAARVLDGEPVGVICRDLNARGARMPTGRPFDHGAMKKLLMRPRLAGLMPDGEHEAAWAPVLDRATWEAVCAVLQAKAAGYGYATNARKYLLSGIARCSECGSGLQIRMESRKPLTGYGCVQPGCRKVQRSRELLDEYAITRTLAKLGDPRNPPGRLPEHAGLTGEFRGLALRLAQTEALITDPAETTTHLPLLLRRREVITQRLAELRELAAGAASARLLGAHTGITREQFDALPLATRRALVAACFTITVLPASKRGPGFRTEDVVLSRPDHDRS